MSLWVVSISELIRSGLSGEGLSVLPTLGVQDSLDCTGILNAFFSSMLRVVSSSFSSFSSQKPPEPVEQKILMLFFVFPFFPESF